MKNSCLLFYHLGSTLSMHKVYIRKYFYKNGIDPQSLSLSQRLEVGLKFYCCSHMVGSSGDQPPPWSFLSTPSIVTSLEIQKTLLSLEIPRILGARNQDKDQTHLFIMPHQHAVPQCLARNRHSVFVNEWYSLQWVTLKFLLLSFFPFERLLNFLSQNYTWL